ncbi:MAG: hypothetical protein KDB00_01755 [Planctomycetales bacterium]|nr:hypothetical protein [Planctomycetales bacterium]
MITWEPLYRNVVYVLLAMAIVATVLFARRIAVSDKTRHWSVLVLRGILLAALAVLLLNPINSHETVLPPRPPSVAFLVDCSQSMGLGTKQSRIEQVKQVIGTTARDVQKEREIGLPMFRFGKHLSKVPGLAELTATDDASLLSGALQRLSSRIADGQTRAVVVFSDGAVEIGDQMSELVAAYREQDIPVYTMLPDQNEMLGDIAITKLSVPSDVANGDKATIRGVIESRGFDGQRVVVAIRPADRPHSTPLATLPITLGRDTTACELVVTADPSYGDLAIEVPVQSGEAVSTNNRITFQLTKRDRKISVLYMEGTSAEECRWLQDALHADPDIKCVSMTVNNQYAARPQLQRIDDAYRGFPETREELFQYDVVICSDIAYTAFTPEQIDWTVELVSRRGGGFVMVGGYTSFGAGGWDRTPWEGLIPFDMTNRRDLVNQYFQVVVPEQAQSHPIWEILEDPQANRAALASMPPFSGTNLISRVKPAATLLGQTQSPLNQVGIMPVFACESYGRGRTFAMSTDTTVGWGTRFEREWGSNGNGYYQKFWRNVVRWLAENSLASQQRLIARTDQVIYAPDETIQLVAEAYDSEFKPTTNYRLTARFASGDSQNASTAQALTHVTDVGSVDVGHVDLTAVPSAQHYTASIPAELPQSIDDPASPMQTVHLEVTAWDGDEKVATNSIELQVIHRSDEWLNPQSRPETLALVAEAGGGRMLTSADELNRLLRSFDVAAGEIMVHKLPMWDHWILWTLILLILGVDWTLRRRRAAVG